MIAFLSAAEWVKWVVIGIIALVVFSIIMHFINRAFRVRYALNLFGGGLLMLVAGGGLALGVLGFNGSISKGVGFVGIGVAVICILITLIYDFKKCGGMGFVAFLCQIIFAPCSLFLILELFSSHGRTSPYGTYQDRRSIQRARAKKGYSKPTDGRYY